MFSKISDFSVCLKKVFKKFYREKNNIFNRVFNMKVKSVKIIKSLNKF